MPGTKQKVPSRGAGPPFAEAATTLAFFARVGTQHLRRSGQPDFEDELSKRVNLDSNYVLVTQELYSHRNTVHHKGT